MNTFQPIINIFRYFGWLMLKAIIFSFSFFGVVSLFFVAYNKAYLTKHINIYGSYLQKVEASFTVERVLSELDMLQIYFAVTFYFLIILLFTIDLTSGRILKHVNGKKRVVFMSLLIMAGVSLSSCSPGIEYPQQFFFKGESLSNLHMTIDTVYSESMKTEYVLPLEVKNNPMFVISPSYGPIEILATREKNKINGKEPIVIKFSNYGFYRITLSEEAFCKQRYEIGVWFLKEEPKSFY